MVVRRIFIHSLVVSFMFVIVCSQNGISINGLVSGDFSGEAVGIGGDVNGDGIGDIIIGSISAGGGTGQCYVIFGNNTFPSRFNLGILNGPNGFTINGLVAGDSSGTSVFIGGDANGDDLADIIIGAPNANGGGITNSGQVYVIFGKTTGFTSPFNLYSLNGTNGLIINGDRTRGFLGVLASLGGDVNGDGFGDIAIGSPDTNSNGRAHIIFGKNTSFVSRFSVTSLNGTNGFTVNGLATGDEAGKSISIDGDINGDAINDIVIGALNADPNGVSSGQAYVIFGTTSPFSSTFDLNSLTGANGFIINGITAGGEAGKVVSLGGDVNGDKFGDILIGSVVGNGYIIFGKNSTFTSPLDLNNLTGSNGFTITGIASNGEYGRPFSLGGDVNDDGFDDILIGSHTTSSSEGQGYVIFGQSTFTSSLALTSLNGVNGFSIITGGTTDDLLGYSVSLGGDMNGDGTKDIMLSAKQADPSSVTNTGQSFVIFGRNIKKTLFPSQINLSKMNSIIIRNQTRLTNATFQTNQNISIQINASDFGSTLGSPYVFSATVSSSNPLPSGLTFSPTSLKFEGQTNENGTFEISVIQSNFYGTVEVRFYLTIIIPLNEILSLRTITVETEQYFMFHIEQQQFISYIGQPDNYSASLSPNPLPSWILFSSNNLSFEGISNHTGKFNLTIVATNFNGTVTAHFLLDVVLPQREFVINSDQSFSIQVPDPTGGSLLFDAQLKSGAPLPAFITFNSSSLVLASVPSIQIVPQIVYVNVIGKDENDEEKVKYDYSFVFTADASSGSGNDVNIGAIVGGTVGGVCFLVIVVVVVGVIVLFVKKKIDERDTSPKINEEINF